MIDIVRSRLLFGYRLFAEGVIRPVLTQDLFEKSDSGTDLAHALDKRRDKYLVVHAEVSLLVLEHSFREDLSHILRNEPEPGILALLPILPAVGGVVNFNCLFPYYF